MRKRTRNEILTEILRLCLKPRKKTHIVNQVNLNFRILPDYVRPLESNGHLARNGIEYLTTIKGKELLETLEVVNEIT